MIAHRGPQMLALLLGSQRVSIDGYICVDVDRPTESLRWASVLLNPTVFAWRSTVTGERCQVCGSSAHDPVHGRVTVVLDGDRHRDLWDAMQQDGLRSGEEERIDLQLLRQAALKRRRRERATSAA